MLIVKPSVLTGKIKIQSSKSVLHRAFICAALANGRSKIQNITFSNDILATLNALRDLGLCDFSCDADEVNINGSLQQIPKYIIDSEESGTTLRMLLPLAATGNKVCFITKGRLSSRPMEPFKLLFKEKGVKFRHEDDSFIIEGSLKSGEFSLPGNISSQFISGLLFKLPILDGNSTINITTDIESKPYIELTRYYQALFNVFSTWEDRVIKVNGNQIYEPASIIAEGDYSHAAFFAAAGALGGNVELEGLLRNSIQGDRAFMSLLSQIGAKVIYFEHSIKISANLLNPINVDVSNIPDLMPILAVTACGIIGVTKIYNAGRLRFKESDRLSAIANELRKIGAEIYEGSDSLTIMGKGYLEGGRVCTHNDHRIAMALTIASCISKGDIIIDNPEAVNKSAPNFFKQFQSLGGIID